MYINDFYALFTNYIHETKASFTTFYMSTSSQPCWKSEVCSSIVFEIASPSVLGQVKRSELW